MILSTGRQRKGPTLWEEELTRTPFLHWRGGGQGEGSGGGLWLLRGLQRLSWCLVARSSMWSSRVWLFLWQAASRPAHPSQ